MPVQPIETPKAQRVADFKRRQLPIVVWSVCALFVAWMLGSRAAQFEYVGLAQSARYEISATEVGQIDELLVDLYDRVEQGEIVARLRDEEAAARVARSEATIRQLSAELAAARESLLAQNRSERNSWESDLRRFQTDEEDRRLQSMELSVTIESDQIELDRLELEVRRSAPLLEAGLLGQQEFDNKRLQRDSLRSRVDENRILLAQTQNEFSAARARREGFEASHPTLRSQDAFLRPLTEAIEVESRRLTEVQARRRATVLRSPVAGDVSSILSRNGDTVMPGEPILTITDPRVTEILAYVDEAAASRTTAESPVRLATVAQPGRVAESVILRVGPDVELLPERLWSNPSQPQYGRAVVIAAVPTLELRPGELLSVRLGR